MNATRVLIGLTSVLAVGIFVDGTITHFVIRPKRSLTSTYPLRFDSDQTDLGTVTWSDKPIGTYTFTNVTAQTVTINSTEAGCACTIPSLSNQVIRSGEKGWIKVTLNPFGYQGTIHKSLDLQLKGYSNPLTLQFKATVNPQLWANPLQLDLGNLPLSSQPVATFRLHNSSSRTVRIVRTESSEEIDLQLSSRTIADGADLSIGAIVRSPVLGAFHGRITLYTSLPDRPKIEVPITATFTSKWALPTKEFYFGFVHTGESPEAELTVPGLLPVHIRSVRLEGKKSPPGHFDLRATKDGTTVSLKLDLSHLSTEEVQSVVVLKTDDKDEPMLRIPVTCSVQDPAHSNCCSVTR